MGKRVPTASTRTTRTTRTGLRKSSASVRTALRESERRFRRLAEASLEGLAFVQKGVFEDCNDQLAELLGCRRKDLRGRSVLDFIAPEDRKRVEGYVREERQTPYEHLALRKDGTRIPVEVLARRTRIGGKPIRIMAVRDLRDRKRMERLIGVRVRLLEYATHHGMLDLLEKALDEAGELTLSPVGFYHFVEADQKTLSLQAWSTRTKAEFCKAEGAGLHYPIDQAGVWTDCVRERRAVIHNDYASLPHRKGLPEGHAPLTRELVVPVFRDDRIVAILGVGNKPSDYTEQDVELAMFVADLAWEIAERKQTENELRTTHMGLEDAGIGVLRAGPQAQILSVNAALCRNLGYTEAELCRLTIFDVDPTFTPERWKSHRQSMPARRTTTFESVHRRKDGSTYPVEVTITYTVAQGQVSSVSFIRDITVRRKVEERIERLVNEQRTVLNTITTGIVHLKNRKHQWVNPGFARMFGYETDEVTGLDTATIYLRVEDYQRVGAEGYAALAAGKTYTKEVLMKRKDGSAFWCSITGQAVDPRDPSVGSIWVLQDITERKRAEETLQMFQFTVDQASDAVQWLNRDGGFDYVNDQACRALGYSREELMQMRLWDIDPVFSKERWESDWERFQVERQGGTASVESVHRRKDGTSFPVDVRARHLWFGDRELHVAVARDISDLRLAQQKLEQSEIRFRTIVQQSSDVIALLDHQGIITYISPQADRILGYPPEELVGQNPLAHVHEDDLARLRTALDELVQETNPGIPTVFRFRHAQGHWVHLETLGTNLLEHPGIRGLLVTSRDVTERNRAQEALRAKTEELNQFFSVALDLLCIADTDGRFRRLNPQWERVLGYTLPELEGRNFLDLVHPEDRAATLAAVGQLVEQKSVMNFVNRYRCKDGAYRWIEWRSFPAGNVIYAAARDITERKQAEETLEQTRRLLEAILEQSPVAIVMASAPDLVVRYGNRAAAELLGIADEPNYAGMTLAEIGQRQTWRDLRPDGTPVAPLELPLARAVRGETTRNEELRVIRKDGTERWQLASGTPIYSSTGELIAGLIVFPDITERKLAEERFHKLAAEHRTVLNTVSIGLAFIKDRKHEWVNPAFATMLGYEAEDLVGADGSRFYVNPADYERIGREGYAQLAASGVYTTEALIQRKDGTQLWCDIAGEAVNSENLAEGTIWAVRDITARKQAEAALERERLFTDAVLDSVPGLLYLYDDEGHLIRWNKQHEVITGYSAEELAKMHLLDWFRGEPDESARIAAAVQRIPGDGHAEAEALLVTKSGQRIRFYFTAVNLRIDERDYFVGIGIDITERRRAEAALRENEERLRLALAGTNQGLYDLNLQTGEAIVSPEYLSMLGYSPQEVSTTAAWWQAQVHPDDLEMATRTLGECMHGTRRDYRMEYRLKHKSGDWCWVMSLGRVVETDPEGRPVRMLGTHADITERKRAEEALRLSEARLEAAQAQAHIGSWLVNPVTGEGYWSKEMFRLLGRKPVLGPPTLAEFLEMVAPQDRASLQAAQQHVLETGEPYRGEFEGCLPEGTSRFFAVSIELAKDEASPSRSLVGTLQDITERRQAEAAMVETQERLALALEGANLGSWDWNIQTGEVRVNERWAEMLGDRVEEIEPHVRSWEARLHPDDLPKVLGCLQAHFDGETPFYETEHRMRHKSGNWVWVLDRGRVISRDPGGKPIRAVGTHLDITERKRSDEALRESEQRFRAVVENAQAIIFMLDQQGVFRLSEGQGLAMLGLKPGQVVGRSAFEVYRDTPSVAEGIKRALAGESNRTINWLGDLVFDVVYSPYYTPAGVPDGVVGIAIDITERTRAETAAKESQERLALALEGANLGSWDSDVRTGGIHVNERYAQMLGYEADEIKPLLDQWESLVHPEDLPRMREKLQTHVEGRTSFFETEHRMRHKTGRWVWVLDRGKIIERDTTGKPLRGAGMTLDITDRKRAEEALRESEGKLSSILRVAPTGIGVVSNRILKEINEGVCNMTGYTREELLGQDSRLLYPSDAEYEFVGAEKYRQIKACGTGTVETHWQRKDGTLLDVLLSSTPIQPDDWSVGVTFTALDITERKRSEEALQASRQMLRTVLDTIPTRVFWKDRNSVYLGCNRAFALDHGQEDSNALVGKTDHNTMTAGMAEVYQADDRLVMTSGQSMLSYEEPQIRLDGSRGWLLTNKVPLRDIRGNIIGVLGTYEDITERKRAEAALRESEVRYRSLFEGNPHPMWFYDLETLAFLAVNDAAVQHYGYSREEFLAMTIADIRPAEDVARLKANVAQVKETGVDEAGIWRHRKKDGTLIEVEITSHVLNFKERHAELVLAQDITERRRVEAALRESEERFRSLFERSRAIMLLIEPNSGAIAEANPAAAEFYGYPRERLCQMNIEEINPLPEAEVQAARKQAAQGRAEGFSFPHRLASGEIRTVEVRSSPVTVSGRSLLFSIIQDITERKRAEEALEQERDLLGTVINLLPDGIYVKNRDSRFLLANQTLAERFGKQQPAELLGLSDRDFFPPDMHVAFRADEERVLAGEQLRDKEEHVVFPDGQARVILTTKVPLRNRRGEVVGVVGTGLDVTEPKRAEEALRESMRRLQTVVTGAPIVLYSFDRHGIFTLSQGRGLAGLGLKPGEIVGRSVFEVYGGLPEPMAALRRALAGESFTVELSFPAGGTFEASHIALRDDAGAYNGTIGVLVDITERERAQAAVRESEEKFRTLVETTNDFIWEVDAEGCYTYASPQVAWLLGYTSEEVLGRSPFDFMPPDEATRVRVVFGELMTARQPLSNLENVNCHKDGRMVVVETSGTPIVDAVGHLRGYRGIDRDITERKRAEEALRLSEQKFRSFVETTQEWIWIMDAEGRHTFSNPAVETILGYAPAELLGRAAIDMVHPEDRDTITKVLQDETVLRAGWSGVVLRWRHKDGSDRFLESSAVPAFDAHGRCVGFQGTDRDITERKLAEQERERLIRELEAKNTELERFTYTVSHDLKSPLITIKGFAGALLQDVSAGRQERVANDLQRISAATDKMAELLKDLLELSRIGRIMNPPSDVKLSDLVQEVLELLAGILNERTVQVTVHPGLPTVRGDRRRLAEVFQNLIENAVRFLGQQPQPRIEIGLRESEGPPVFFVRDNGVGIDPRYHETVFGLFNKLDAHTPGTGIGLALVRRIVEFHGGRVWVESEGAGRGATFCFTLPPSNHQP